MTGRIRMEDIAAAAGCSTMTVSLALRNSHRISAETRERVTRLARELGYRPDPFASAFMIRRAGFKRPDTDVIAVLTKYPVQRRPRAQTFFSELWAGLEERGTELGFCAEEIPVYGRNAPSGRELTRILTTRGIKGIVLFPGGGLTRPYPELDWRQFAVVAAGFHGTGIPVHRIASDYSHAMEIALREVEQRGYRRPGLAVTQHLDPLIRFGLSGRFFSWQQSQPRTRRVPPIPGLEETPEAATFVKWLRAQRPDVVMTLDPNPRWMRDLALKTNADIGFVHLAKRNEDEFAGVNLNTRNVGKTTIDVLVRELYLNRFGHPDVSEVVQVACRWEEGESVRSRSVSAPRRS